MIFPVANILISTFSELPESCINPGERCFLGTLMSCCGESMVCYPDDRTESGGERDGHGVAGHCRHKGNAIIIGALKIFL